MAKLFPFVNKDTPAHILYGKILTKFKNSEPSDRMHLMQVILTNGVEEIEESLKSLPYKDTTTNKVILNFIFRKYQIIPIPFDKYLTIRSFLYFCNSIHNLTLEYFNSNFLSLDEEYGDKDNYAARAEFLACSRLTSSYTSLDMEKSLVYKYHEVNLVKRKVFDENSKHTLVIENYNDLRGYLMAHYYFREDFNTLQIVMRKIDLAGGNDNASAQ